MAVNAHVRAPYQSYLGMMRFDWAQSQRSQWFLRYALDNSTTNNALVQQGTLPSTGATTHYNYQRITAMPGTHVLLSLAV